MLNFIPLGFDLQSAAPWLLGGEALCLKALAGCTWPLGWNPGRFKCWSTALRGFSWPAKTRRGGCQISPSSSFPSQQQRQQRRDEKRETFIAEFGQTWKYERKNELQRFTRHSGVLINPRQQLRSFSSGEGRKGFWVYVYHYGELQMAPCYVVSRIGWKHNSSITQRFIIIYRRNLFFSQTHNSVTFRSFPNNILTTFPSSLFLSYNSCSCNPSPTYAHTQTHTRFS